MAEPEPAVFRDFVERLVPHSAVHEQQAGGLFARIAGGSVRSPRRDGALPGVHTVLGHPAFSGGALLTSAMLTTILPSPGTVAQGALFEVGRHLARQAADAGSALQLPLLVLGLVCLAVSGVCWRRNSLEHPVLRAQSYLGLLALAITGLLWGCIIAIAILSILWIALKIVAMVMIAVFIMFMIGAFLGGMIASL